MRKMLTQQKEDKLFDGYFASPEQILAEPINTKHSQPEFDPYGAGKLFKKLMQKQESDLEEAVKGMDAEELKINIINDLQNYQRLDFENYRTQAYGNVLFAGLSQYHKQETRSDFFVPGSYARLVNYDAMSVGYKNPDSKAEYAKYGGGSDTCFGDGVCCSDFEC